MLYQMQEVDSQQKCSGIRNRFELLELVVGFQCTNCTQGAVVRTVSQELCRIQVTVNTLECLSVVILDIMISSWGGAEEASRMIVKCAWENFRELSSIPTARNSSLKMKGKVYRACVQSVLMATKNGQ